MNVLGWLIWIVILSLIVFGPRLLRWWWTREPKDTFGSAHWMSAKELKATGLITEKAGIVLGRVGRHTVRDAGEGHVLLVAPSRGGGIHGVAGKGTTCVLPTCFEFPGDLVCIDPKGENVEMAGTWREAHGSLVSAFDPMGDYGGSGINLLDSLRWGTPHALGDADTVARGFIPDPGPTHPESRYYAKQGADILSAVFLYLKECADERTMGGALRFLTTPEPLAKRLQRLMTSTHPAVQATAQQLITLKEHALPLWSSAISALELWRDPRIDERTRQSDIDLGAFQTGDHPLSLFLRSPENQLERLAPLMRTIVQVIIGRCMERSLDRSRRKLLFLLDEFSSMGPCLPIVAALPRMAGYQLRCALIVQDLTDIVRLYGRDNNIVQNCAARCFMTPNDVNTAFYITRLLGVQTVEHLAERSGTTMGPSGTSESDSAGLIESARGLMTLDEVLRLDEQNTLIFLSGQSPLMATKIAWNDPAYAEARSMKGAYAHSTAS